MPPILSVQSANNCGDGLTLYLQYAPNSTLATTQLCCVFRALWRAASFEQNVVANTEVPQPFVSTLCRLNTIMGENDTRPLEFPDAYIMSEDYGINNYTAITRKQIWNQHRSQRKGQIIWVDDIAFSSGRGLGALLIQPELCKNGQSYLSVSVCAVGAQWFNTAAYFNQFPVTNNLTLTFVNTLPTWSQHALFISKSWANHITSTIGYQNQTIAHNLLSSLLLRIDVCPWIGSYPSGLKTRPYTHEGLLSSLIANVMSKLGGEGNMYFQEIRDGKLPEEQGQEDRRVDFVLPIERQ